MSDYVSIQNSSNQVREQRPQRGGDALGDAVHAEIVGMHGVCDQKIERIVDHREAVLQVQISVGPLTLAHHTGDAFPISPWHFAVLVSAR